MPVNNAPPSLDSLRKMLGRPVASAVLPLIGYGVFSVAWLGRGVVLHPQSRVFGDRFPDKTIFMWSFLWWPHQLVHAHDPFFTKAIWAPHGIDLAWVTSMPGASLLLAPLSETVGPVFAYNVAAIAAPALASWTTFLLARRLSSSVPAALVAGFLFGFSPYIAGQSSSHLNLTLVFLVPLLGYLAVVFVQGGLGGRRYVVLAALALAVQFYFSTEIFATFTLIAVVCFAIAWLVLTQMHPTLRALGRCTLVAYALAGVLALPYLLHAFAGGTTPPARGVIPASEDLANVVVPTRTTWLRPPGSDSVTGHFASNGAEQGAYLGVPLILIVVLAAIMLRGRRRRGVWVLVLSALASTLLALGPRMRVDGHELAAGIWAGVGRLPAIHTALPIRFDMYTILFAALIAGIWLTHTSRRHWWPYLLAALAVVAFLPTPSYAHWTSQVPQSRFLTASAHRRYIHPGETALVLPYGPTGWSMLWQAETHFRFRMIGGWVGRSILRADCRWYWEYRALIGVRPPDDGAGLRRFLITHHVALVVEGPGTQVWAAQLISAALSDLRPERIADATILRLPVSLPLALPENSPSIRPAAVPQNLPSELPCRVPPYARS